MANVGFRIYMTLKRPKKELVEAFTGMPVANIADNMNRMSCIDSKIRPMNNTPLLGTALTVKCRPGDNLLLHKAIDMAGPGDVIVVDAQGDLTHAVIGELMISWLQQRGTAGVIVDGAVRDVGHLRKINFPVYAAGVTPKGPYKEGPGEINVPVSCGGVVVKPGDILVGDADGVVVIDPADAPGILEKTKVQILKEAGITEDIKNNRWARAWVDEALRAKGCEYIQ
jgi:RraA family protein